MLVKFCPECLDHTPVGEVLKEEKAELNGELIRFDAKYYECERCGNLVPNNELENENYKTMYRIYREKKS